MKIPRCKGAKDLTTQEMNRFRHAESVFHSCCSSWGYGEIRTPTLEYLHLFTSAGTLSPEMLGRVYSFLDWDGWSGERVVLRPDGTIPAARLYVENMPDKPLSRLFYVENMFSFEGTGEQSRERWQCGVELIGGAEPDGDSELIMLALEIMGKLGIGPVNLELSHMGFLKALSHDLGFEGEEGFQNLKQILTDDAALSTLDKPAEVKRFLKLLSDLKGKKAGFLGNLKGMLPEDLSATRPYLDSMTQITGLLDSIGQEYWIDFTPTESFEYYTGMVFRFYCAGKLLGHGGRYDELIPLVGGKDIPASGFALFMDNITPLVQVPGDANRVLISAESPETRGSQDILQVAAQLRKQGHIVEMDMGTGTSSRPQADRWLVTLKETGETPLLHLLDKKTGAERKDITPDELLSHLSSL
ncbi:MAG: ATP phosphoribosyltransferase regulatory subunit [Dehalococcoidia bacterium]